MKLFIALVVLVVLVAISACVSWKSGKLSEIHKIRAAFHDHEALMKKAREKLSDEYFRGFDEAEKILDEIEEEEKL